MSNYNQTSLALFNINKKKLFQIPNFTVFNILPNICQSNWTQVLNPATNQHVNVNRIISI